MGIQKRNDLICYASLIAALIIIRYIIILGPDTPMLQSQRALFSWGAIGIIGLLGFTGVYVLNLTGLKKLWDTDVGIKNKIVLPLLVGLLLGSLHSLYDMFSGAGNQIAESMGLEGIHLAFPYSIPVYLGGAIIVSTIYYLIPLSIIVYLVSRLILKGKAEATVYWSAGILIAFYEPLTNPGISIIREVGLVALPLSISVLVFNLVTILFIRRYGFIAALLLRIGHYAVWHVIYPAF